MAKITVPDSGPHPVAAAYTMLVLATIAVALRFWSRYISHEATFWWDDWFALMALVCWICISDLCYELTGFYFTAFGRGT